MKKLHELIEERKKLIAEMRGMLFTETGEKRDNLSTEETAKYQGMVQRAQGLGDMIEAEMRQVAQEEELRRIPLKPEGAEKGHEFRDIRTAMAEKRAITVNGTGAVAVVQEIVKQLLPLNRLTSKFRTFYGPNASTVIPILTPHLATPAGQSEGATSVASDSTAVLAAKTLQPKCYVSVLPVSAEAMLMSGANLDAQLPAIFAEAFGAAMLSGSITGDGTGNNMTGMFLDAALTNNKACAAAGTPKLLDMVNLALEIMDKTENGLIVCAPSILASLIAETTAESAPIKQELLTSRSIMGVPVVPTSYAPTTLTAGSVVAVGMDMSNYALAIANDLVITPIRVKSDTNTYFQAEMFFNGTPVNPKNGWQLVTA